MYNLEKTDFTIGRGYSQEWAFTARLKRPTGEKERNMFFERADFAANIVTAGHMSWESRKITVKARPYHALSLRLVGEGALKMDGGVYDLHAGEVLFVPANREYEADYSATEILVFHFTAAVDDEWIKPAIFRGSEKIAELFSGAVAAYREKTPGYKMLATAKFYEILALLCGKAEDSDAALVHATSFIGENFRDPELRIEDVCRAVGVSESTLRRKFYDRFNLSPVDYIIELRLDYARDEIAVMGRSVTEAAENAGFTEPKYFSRLMKKRRGVSPSDLRIKVV